MRRTCNADLPVYEWQKGFNTDTKAENGALLAQDVTVDRT